ncbi:STAS domain-containing protein [Bacillus lacus]|uniref:STAS domain-containing protein n=1 Tax=Metabacillus lacus TaxID=1983721 RepID=A0A7X2M185_9BACI|nr:STAS domain-containing protein [Metabacillus lacus]MRX73834.1 STAS domain-containing protein [Metabacillus lacus]
MTEVIKQDINGTEIQWSTINGSLTYEGEHATLFWIETTLKSLFDTFEEITGPEELKVVLQTAGYRTGKIVGEGMYAKKRIDQVLKDLHLVYLNAGWGKITLQYINLEKKEITMKLENMWETKLVKKQAEDRGTAPRPGYFIPGHMAGALSVLLQENVWYEDMKGEKDENSYSLLKFSPSDVDPDRNVYELIRSKEKQQIRKLEEKVSERTRELTSLISDLSTPLIPIFNNTIVIPLIGKFEERRASELMDKILTGIKIHHAKYLLLDLTGIKEIDQLTISILKDVIGAVRLLGTKTSLVGISPELSLQMVDMDFNSIYTKCFSTLQHGLMYTMSMEGLAIVSKDHQGHL